MKTIYHLAISRLKYNKGRSILTIVAIALMTTLLMSIGSSALTVIRHQQLEIKESARNYHAVFKGSTADQVFILENHADVESLSTRESVAYEQFTAIMARPYVMGKDLIAAGLQPGVQFSEILSYAHKLRLAGIEKENALRQSLAYARKMRKENPDAAT